MEMRKLLDMVVRIAKVEINHSDNRRNQPGELIAQITMRMSLPRRAFHQSEWAIETLLESELAMKTALYRCQGRQPLSSWPWSTLS